jgi:integrase
MANPRWAQNTKRVHWKGLAIFDRFLRQEGIITESFIEGVPCPPVAPGRKAPNYTEEDFEILLACCSPATWTGVRNRAILWTLWRTGFRKSEFAAMRVRDVHMDDNWIETPTSKNGEAYGTTLFPQTKEAIKHYLEMRPFQKAEALWVTDNGSAMTAGALTLTLRRIHARARNTKWGFPKPLYFHAFRHNYGRNTVRWGLSTRETADAMGQRSERAAVIYTREVTAEEGQKKLRRIAGLSA